MSALPYTFNYILNSVCVETKGILENLSSWQFKEPDLTGEGRPAILIIRMCQAKNTTSRQFGCKIYSIFNSLSVSGEDILKQSRPVLGN